MVPILASLGIGLILGYVAQRSRICFIGGLRDFILVRDTELLKGAVAFFVTAWVAFSLAAAAGLLDGQSLPTAAGFMTVNWQRWVVIGVAGVALGLFSTLANGCPTRQHVLAAQGHQDSAFYLIGFYLGVVVFYLLTRHLLAMFL